MAKFEVMLAKKYFDYENKLDTNQWVTITEKLDGVRCILMATHKDGVRLFSRTGNALEGFVDIEEQAMQLLKWMPNGFVMDGELLVANREGIPSAMQYKATTKITGSKAQEKHGITFNAFDIMTCKEFNEQYCATPYWKRRIHLDAMKPYIKSRAISIVPVIYRGRLCSANVMELLHDEQEKQHEGIMINRHDAPYNFGRTSDLLKVKVMQDCDLRVVGMEYGTGRNASWLGTMYVDYKGNRVGVSTGFNDEQRREIISHPERYIGKIATVQYFEETKNAAGVPSLRFPVFKSWRDDKTAPSYN